MKYPNLVVSDSEGHVFEIPEFYMAGMQIRKPVLPQPEDLIPLPVGRDLFVLPDRAAMGYDPRQKRFVEVRTYRGNPVFAVAAFMAPAYLQFHRSAYLTLDGAPRLPLYSYTALGWQNGQFYVSATRIDPDPRQDLPLFDLQLVAQKAQEKLHQHAGNRLVYHLIENCTLTYGCPAARNFVLERWECPIPTSSGCNAGCVGCISEQPESAGIPPSQERLQFQPTVEEILEFTVPHLKHAERAVVSFGQGCEGEPLTEAELLEQAIREIRKRTRRGIINLNTNGSRPGVVERLCRAGLDSIRVSLNSAQPAYYRAYYQPRNYDFTHVVETLRIMRKYQRWASINYLVFSGFTDHPQEMHALEALITSTQIDMIQTRNLNIDPEWYIEVLGLDALSPEQIGMSKWLQRLRKKFPQVKLGYFNPSRQTMVA